MFPDMSPLKYELPEICQQCGRLEHHYELRAQRYGEEVRMYWIKKDTHASNCRRAA